MANNKKELDKALEELKQHINVIKKRDTLTKEDKIKILELNDLLNSEDK